MQLTFFGVIWIVAVACCFLSNDHRRMLGMTMFSMVFQSNNVLLIGETGIGVQVFTVAIAWVRLWLVKREPCREKSMVLVKGLLTALLIALTASLITNKSFEQTNIIPMLMMVVYTAFFYALSGRRLRITPEWLERIENRILVFVLVIGFLQVMCKSGAEFLTEPLRLLIYNDVNNSNVIFNYKDLNRFYSTFMEPSYCSAYLVGAFAAIIVRRKLTYKNIFLCGLTGLAVLMTRSSTGFGGVAIVLCLLVVTRARKKIFKVFVPALCIVAAYLFLVNPELVNEVIFDKVQTSSFQTRGRLDQLALAAFLGSPLLGIGFRNIRASSLVVSLLGEVGVLGCGAYLLVLLCILLLALKKNTRDFTRQRSYFVLGVMICQTIACPDLNFSPFWMAMYFWAMSVKMDQYGEERNAV